MEEKVDEAKVDDDDEEAPQHGEQQGSVPNRGSEAQEDGPILGPAAAKSASGRGVFGGFAELNQACKLYRRIGSTVQGEVYGTLESLHRGSPGATSMTEENSIKFEAYEKSIRQIAGWTIGLFFSFLVLCNVIFIHVAHMTIRDAMLYTAYSITSTGFGMVEIPKTPGFLFFIILFMYIGIAGVTLVACLVYLYISLESSKVKRRVALEETKLGAKASDKARRCRPLSVIANAFVSCTDFCASTVRHSELGRACVIGGYLLSLLLLGTFVMMYFEPWSFVKSLYYATYVMTTVGYGDVTPESQGGIWFTVFWLPFNITFLAIYMGNLARYFKMASDAFTRRVYKRMKGDLEKAETAPFRQDLENMAADDACEAATPKIQTMGDVVNLVLESLCMEHEHGEISSTALNRFLRLQSPWGTSGTFYANKVRRPSFALQVLMLERLAAILVHDVAGTAFDFYEKDQTYVLSIDAVQQIAEKWMLPAGVRDSFCVLAYEVTVYIGEKRLVLEGIGTLFNLPPLELHKMFAPVLASFEDAGTMEGWLAITEADAAALGSVRNFSRQIEKSAEGEHADNMMINGNLCHNDVKTLLELDAKFCISLEDRQTRFAAQYRAIRLITVGAVGGMLLYEIPVTVGIIINADLAVDKGILFTLYTMTSAGFGNVAIPKTNGFLGFAVLNVFISISALAIVVAQTFLYARFKSLRRAHARDKVDVAGRGQTALVHLMQPSKQTNTARDVMRIELLKALQMVPKSSPSKDHFLSTGSRVRAYLFETDVGRSICVATILLFLLLLGTFAMMITEGWTFLEGFYFSTYALLTVGHGDLVPVTSAGLWFLNCWLPFNVLFLALYLGSVAHIYVRFSEKNVKRLEANIRASRMKHAEKKSTGSTAVPRQPDSPVLTRHEDTAHRRKSMKQKSIGSVSVSDGDKIFNFRDLMQKLHQPSSTASDDKCSSEGKRKEENRYQQARFFHKGDVSDIVFSPRYQTLLRSAKDDTQFALRLHVLDRLARIICAQLIDFHSKMSIDGNTLRVSVDSLKDWVADWKIPHGARSAYRDVTFESLLFVGEKQILVHGVSALFDLSIIEFIELFSPFVFALGDDDTMKGWLENTHDLANRRLQSELGVEEQAVTRIMSQRRVMKNTIEDYFPSNPGNAIRIKLQ